MKYYEQFTLIFQTGITTLVIYNFLKCLSAIAIKQFHYEKGTLYFTKFSNIRTILNFKNEQPNALLESTSTRL